MKTKEKFNRNAVKQRGFKRFLKSFQYSIEGLIYAYKYEQSMLVHFLATVFAVVMGFIFKISATEWLFIFVAIGIVLAVEMINTSIEAIVDMVTLEIHPLAKIAKDAGSAATFIVSLISVVIALIIFAPKIMDLLG